MKLSLGISRALVACTAAALLGCEPPMIEYRGRRIFNPAYLPYLEAEQRDTWQRPDEVLAALALAPGDVVADIGAGGGYFAVRFAHAVGPSGRVYATDVHERMIEALQYRVASEGLDNVEVVRADFDDPSLPERCCDLVFLSSVYKELQSRVAYMGKVQRLLRPGGRVAILEFRPGGWRPGPPRDVRLPEERVEAELSAAGFELRERHDFLPREYFLVFVPAP